jgi:hypothetical protein
VRRGAVWLCAENCGWLGFDSASQPEPEPEPDINNININKAYSFVDLLWSVDVCPLRPVLVDGVSTINKSRMIHNSRTMSILFVQKLCAFAGYDRRIADSCG